MARAKSQAFDHAYDGRGQSGTQGFFQSPLCLLVVLCRDQKDTRRIEPEAMQAMSIRKALFIDPIRSGDDEHRSMRPVGLCDATEQRGCEANGGCGIRGGVGGNLMERAKGQAALREMRIECVEVERKNGHFSRGSSCLRQHPAKSPDGLFAALGNGFGIERRHHGNGGCISFSTIEQNKNNANRSRLCDRGHAGLWRTIFPSVKRTRERICNCRPDQPVYICVRVPPNRRDQEEILSD